MAASIRPGEDSGGVFVDCNSNGPPVILKTEPVVEDKNENGQAGQYFVDKVTGEYYFRSSNGDLEQLLAADMDAGEISIQTVSEQVLVPDGMVGLIIGRGGEQITRLQAESRCKIQMAQDGQGQQHRYRQAGKI